MRSTTLRLKRSPMPSAKSGPHELIRPDCKCGAAYDRVGDGRLRRGEGSSTNVRIGAQHARIRHSDGNHDTDQTCLRCYGARHYRRRDAVRARRPTR
jgi:hypothetical protein